MTSSQSIKARGERQAATSPDENTEMQLPFFISCGADGQIKLFEYNSYALKQGDDDKDQADKVEAQAEPSNVEN